MNAKKLDGIIFDVDGTLWDSTSQVAEVWNLAIQRNSDLDIRVDVPLLKTLFGKTMTEIANAVFPDLEPEEQTRIINYCYTFENEYLEEHPGIVYNGVEETFRLLSEDTGLYIVSNCQCGYIEIFLKASGLEKYVKDHLCFGDTLVSKGQTIRILMERNNLKHVVYVGDTQGDADACREAGIPFIFAEYGFGDVPDAKERIGKITDLTVCV